MIRGVLKEIMIILLLILAVILLLGVVLYDYVPLNKVIPEEIRYTPTEEIKAALEEAKKDNTNEEPIMTSQVTATDLRNYQNGNEYKAGRKNPFAITEAQPAEGTPNATSGSTAGTTSGNSSSNGSTSGTGDTSSSTNYYPDKGTK